MEATEEAQLRHLLRFPQPTLASFSLTYICIDICFNTIYILRAA